MGRRNVYNDLGKIRNFFLRVHRMPSYSEIARIFGFASKNSSYKLVKKLIAKDFIAKDKKGKLIPKKLVPPLPVVGNVAAGFPSPAEEELVDTMSFDEYLVPSPTSSFILKVNGDSMIDAGINPGDLVIVDRRQEVRSGDIVLACVDREWTLKFFEKISGKVCLVPGNKKYQRIYPKEELVIKGVVSAVVRKYR